MDEYTRRLEQENIALRADLLIQEHIIASGRNPVDKEKIVKLSMENITLRADNAELVDYLEVIHTDCEKWDEGKQNADELVGDVLRAIGTLLSTPHPGDSLLKELDGLRKVAEGDKFHWTPMKEKTPQKSGNYLCWYQDGFGNKGPWVGYWDDSRKDFYPKWPNNPSRTIKYWGNLPESPKAGEA